MTPLAIIKYIVERLQGTTYEPWVNALLFMLLFVAILAAIMFLLGKGGRKLVSNAASAVTEKLKNRRGFAPEWEQFRLRVEPYVDLGSSIYFAFVGLYSALLVGIAAVLAMHKAPAWALLVCMVWVLASFFYMRINLEAASWAYHKIKSRKKIGVKPR
ncbi:MAG: hypothetical protein FWF20_01340 [Betaproteobacteria bacterium]|nr:hypothetical protein [Betaproteobacteria bacterium]MCL2885425.1 hypothetical protein [Betaproteobacteria bacterium]